MVCILLWSSTSQELHKRAILTMATAQAALYMRLTTVNFFSLSLLLQTLSLLASLNIQGRIRLIWLVSGAFELFFGVATWVTLPVRVTHQCCPNWCYDHRDHPPGVATIAFIITATTDMVLLRLVSSSLSPPSNNAMSGFYHPCDHLPSIAVYRAW